jgi:hypothetical protein
MATCARSAYLANFHGVLRSFVSAFATLGSAIVETSSFVGGYAVLAMCTGNFKHHAMALDIFTNYDGYELINNLLCLEGYTGSIEKGTASNTTFS